MLNKKLSEDGFLKALLDEATAFDIVQAGHTQAHPQWFVQRRAIVEHLLYLFTEHECEAHIGGRKMLLRPGSLIWVSAGVMHEFRIPAGRPQFSFFHFKIGIANKAGAALRPPRDYVVLNHVQELHPACQQLIREAHASGPVGDLRWRASLLLLMSAILAMAQTASAGGTSFTQRQKQMLSDYVQKNVTSRPRPADLAKQLRLSSDYFTREFRRSYGMSPRAWLVRERMNVAAQRLAESPLTISEIAYALGFSDVFLFSRQFKKVFGRSPRAFRRER